MSTAQLRKAGTADAAALSLVGQATFLESFAGLHTAADILAHCHRNHSEAVYGGWLADVRFDAWLLEAVTGAAPVGYAVLAPADVPVPDPRPDDLELKRIYLLQPWQGAGHGHRLIDAVANRARERGSRRLLLGVWTRNESAVRFYERVGFTRAGTRTFHIGTTECTDHLLGLPL